jgi:hypothetical protein
MLLSKWNHIEPERNPQAKLDRPWSLTMNDRRSLVRRAGEYGGPYAQSRTATLFRGECTLQFGQRGEHLFTVLVGLDVEPDLFDFPLRIDQEGMP